MITICFHKDLSDLELICLNEATGISVILVPDHHYDDDDVYHDHNDGDDSVTYQSFMNSTLESRGLSKRKSSRKFSSIGRS